MNYLSDFGAPDFEPVDPISRKAFEQIIATRGEGEDYDFKETLGDLSTARARVELAKDALAFCNLARGGTIIIGVTDNFERVGLKAGEKIDTTRVHTAVDKYLDGDYSIATAEYEIAENGGDAALRFGIIHFRRRSVQPVLAAQQGLYEGLKNPVFRSGDIFIRRGAASVKANSGDVRRLFTSSIVDRERMSAVNELWRCAVELRKPLGGLEFLYDAFADTEYQQVISRPDMRGVLPGFSYGDNASRVDELNYRVKAVRPHLSDQLYELYRSYAAFVGRVQMKAINQRDRGILRPWTDDDKGAPDEYLYELARKVLSQAEVAGLWQGRTVEGGSLRPLRPMIDAAEYKLVVAVRRVLNGLA